MAAPFGPPPHSATTSILPSGVTRLSVPRFISTTSTLPSGMAIGPSGNSRPDAIRRTFSMAADHRESGTVHTGPEVVGGSRQLDLDGRVDTAPHQPVRLHNEPAWCDDGIEVVSDAIRDVLVIRALLAKAPQVELQRLELHDRLVRHVRDRDGGEV